MTENAHKHLLDRDEAEKAAIKALAKQIELLDQMANYGSNLLVRVLHTNKSKHIRDLIVCSVFLRQVVAMLDSLAIAFRAGSAHLALLAARPGFEATIYLEWMLLSDTKKKGEYYYVANLRRNRLWALRSTAGTPQNAKMASDPQLKSILDAVAAEAATPAQAQIAEFDRICGKDAYKSINEAFEKACKGNKEKDWYNLLGMDSIRAVAKSLNRLVEYDLFYSGASQLLHSSAMGPHIKVHVKDEFTVKPIRTIEGATSILNFCIGAAIRSFQLIVNHYRPGEAKTFSRIYAEEWRAAYLGIPKISVTYSKSSR